MYYYLYDTFLNSNKYQKTLTKIENRLNDLGISGRIGKLSILKDVNELIKDEYNLGTKNFIAVGRDDTLLKVINAVSEYDVTVGYIPVGPDNYLANLFGLLPEELACDILSTRIVKKIDLGKINNHYFLLNAKIQANNLKLICDNSYEIYPKTNNSVIDVINLSYKAVSQNIFRNISVQDGYLNIIINKPARAFPNFSKLFKKNKYNLSFFKVKEVQLSNSGGDLKVLVDGIKTFKLPIRIKACSAKLKLIVGRNRKILL